MIKRAAPLLILMLLSGCSVVGVRSDYDQPRFETIDTTEDDADVRRYDGWIAVGTTISERDPGAVDRTSRVR